MIIPVPEVKKDPTKIQTKPQLPQDTETNQPKTAIKKNYKNVPIVWVKIVIDPSQSKDEPKQTNFEIELQRREIERKKKLQRDIESQINKIVKELQKNHKIHSQSLLHMVHLCEACTEK